MPGSSRRAQARRRHARRLGVFEGSATPPTRDLGGVRRRRGWGDTPLSVADTAGYAESVRCAETGPRPDAGKAKGPNKYELFGPFLRLHRSGGALEVLLLRRPPAQEVARTFLWFHRVIHRGCGFLHRSCDFVHRSSVGLWTADRITRIAAFCPVSVHNRSRLGSLPDRAGANPPGRDPVGSPSSGRDHRSTGASGAGGSGSQNAAVMSTAPEGRSGVPSSR